jgi:hypothetical protein
MRHRIGGCGSGIQCVAFLGDRNLFSITSYVLRVPLLSLH